MSADILEALADSLDTGGVRIVDLTHTLSPDFPRHRHAAGVGAVRTIPHGAHLSLRCQRAGLVLEQPVFRRTHRHAFRCPGPLVHRPRPTAEHRRYAASGRYDGALLRHRLFGRKRAGRRLSFDDRPCDGVGGPPWPCSAALLGAASHRLVEAQEAAYANLLADGAHTPGPDAEVMKWLVAERDILGFGTETIGTDAGQAGDFLPPYPAHHYLHGAGRYSGLQCLANLDQGLAGNGGDDPGCA